MNKTSTKRISKLKCDRQKEWHAYNHIHTHKFSLKQTYSTRSHKHTLIGIMQRAKREKNRFIFLILAFGVEQCSLSQSIPASDTHTHAHTHLRVQIKSQFPQFKCVCSFFHFTFFPNIYKEIWMCMRARIYCIYCGVHISFTLIWFFFFDLSPSFSLCAFIRSPSCPHFYPFIFIFFSIFRIFSKHTHSVQSHVCNTVGLLCGSHIKIRSRSLHHTSLGSGGDDDGG